MSEDAIKLALMQLERDWAAAVQQHDVASLEALLGEEYTLTTGRPGSEVRTRQEYLDISRDRYHIESFDFEDFEINVYPHVAVVRSRYRQLGSMDGEDRSMAYLMTDVWVWRDSRWQVVARHISPLQASN